jgi:hypothetical protein
MTEAAAIRLPSLRYRRSQGAEPAAASSDAADLKKLGQRPTRSRSAGSLTGRCLQATEIMLTRRLHRR